MALQGVLLFSINYIIFYFATSYMTSGLVAVTFSIIVILNILFGALLLGMPIRPRVALAGLLGSAGSFSCSGRTLPISISAAAASSDWDCRSSPPPRPRSAISLRRATSGPASR